MIEGLVLALYSRDHLALYHTLDTPEAEVETVPYPFLNYGESPQVICSANTQEKVTGNNLNTECPPEFDSMVGMKFRID